MEREGLVERIRTEQVGRRPARTVYEITADGRGAGDPAGARDPGGRDGI